MNLFQFKKKKIYHQPREMGLKAILYTTTDTLVVFSEPFRVHEKHGTALQRMKTLHIQKLTVPITIMERKQDTILHHP